MFDSSKPGVSISDGRSGIKLTRSGDVGLGYPTRIDIQAGPFSGAVLDENVGDFGVFITGLESLYRDLSGKATIGSLEGFELSLSGNGRGAVFVSAKIIDSQTRSFQLTFTFTIDQTYLPRIIEAVKTEFPLPSIVQSS